MPACRKGELVQNRPQEEGQRSLEWRVRRHDSGDDHDRIQNGSQPCQRERTRGDDSVYSPQVDRESTGKKEQRELEKEGEELHEKVKIPTTHAIQFPLSLQSSLRNCASLTDGIIMQ